MTNEAKHIVLIHGTWSNGASWDQMRVALEHRGYTVNTPTLRHHELPFLEAALRVGTVSLHDYVSDLVEVVQSLDSPPIIGGLSMGGLLCQLVAARCENRGVACFSPAPAWGMFNLYPTTMRTFHYYPAQWGYWRKPFYPSWEEFRWGVMNEHSEQDARAVFASLVPESGRAYREMGYWFIDRTKASKVNIDAITSPVLVVVGRHDRVVPPRIGRVTAKRYGARGTFVELPDADHCMVFGAQLDETMIRFDAWVAENRIYAATS